MSRLSLPVFWPLQLWLFLPVLAAFSACGTNVNPSSSPTFRLRVAPGSVRSSETTLIWTKLPAATRDTSYQVLRDGEPIASTAKLYITVTGLEAAKHYRFQVVAKLPSASPPISSDSVAVNTPSLETVLSVRDFGAVGDGKTKDTKAIQAAIDACPANGVVLLPKGIFLSGALFLKAEMTFEIAADGILQGSPAASDYEPFIFNRFEGWEMDTYASLLNAGRLDHAGPAKLKNLRIRGEGKIVGGGTPLAEEMMALRGIRSRGRLICLMNCANVEIQGLTLENPPSWTLHYIYCEDVTIHGLTIRTHGIHNGDGIDPDSSKNSYIFNCSFATGDDCIAIKSGKNPEGNTINRPTENVRIMDCEFIEGHGISIGSEISGGIRGVLVENCVAGNLLHGFQIKATRDRGSIVEDVTVRDCTLLKISVLTELNYNNDGAPASTPPLFRNFKFENIDLTGAKPGDAIIVNGYSEPDHRTRNVSFDGIRLRHDSIIRVDQAKEVKFAHLVSVDGGQPTFEITRSEAVTH